MFLPYREKGASHLSPATSKSLACGADAWSGGESNSPVTGTVLQWHIAPGCEGGTCESGLCTSDVTAITGRMAAAHPGQHPGDKLPSGNGTQRTWGQGGTQRRVRHPDGTEREPKRSAHLMIEKILLRDTSY